MGGIALGPLTLSTDRAAVLAGILALFLVSGWLARKAGPMLGAWASATVIGGAILSRLGFVFNHFDSYRDDLGSIFTFWQGGFSPLWGALGVALVSLVFVRRQLALIYPMLASLAVALVAWNIVTAMSAGGDLHLPKDAVLGRMDGSTLTTEQWQGRPMVVNLWASWCPPCRREMPMMAEIAQSLDDVDLHFVNQGEGPGRVRDYLAAEGLVMAPVLDHGQRFMRHFGAIGLPATFFIDAEGRVRMAHLGEISRAQLLAGIEDLRLNPSPYPSQNPRPDAGALR